jgi:hypothetical protein
MFLFPSFLCLLAPFLTLEVLPSQRSNKLKKKQKKKKTLKNSRSALRFCFCFEACIGGWLAVDSALP